MSASDVHMPLESTPQERLAASRKAIVRHMERGDQTSQRFSTGAINTDNANEGFADSGDSAHSQGDSNWSVIKKSARAWWHHHPAHVAIDVAKPVVESYARNHPLKVLGIAAGFGAAAVWIKPWRLVSVGSLTALALRSTNITGAVLSMLTSSRAPSPASRDSGSFKSHGY